VAISSVTTLLTFADLGLGYGVLNAVAEAKGGGDRRRAEVAISSATALLSTIALALLVAAAVLGPLVPWADVFNVRTATARAEAGPAVMAFVACLAINLPLGIVVRVQYGLQEGFLANAWSAIGSLVTLVALVAAIVAQAGLPVLVLALVGGPAAATLVNGLVVFGRLHPDLRPALGRVRRPVALQLVRVGALFSITQLALGVAYNSDVFVAARVIGPETAAQYQVTLRLFFLAPQAMSLVLNALWPAYGEAMARGDATWVRATLVRSTAMAGGVVAATSIALLLLAAPIVRAWLGPRGFDPDSAMAAGMAAWAVVVTVMNGVSMPLNAASRVRFQAVVAVLMAVVSVPASVAGGVAFGLPGIIWGTVLAYLACSAAPYFVNVRRLLRQIEAAPQPMTVKTEAA
jgi:O-antigen/teichoic acid export membrane protein